MLTAPRFPTVSHRFPDAPALPVSRFPLYRETERDAATVVWPGRAPGKHLDHTEQARAALHAARHKGDDA